MTSGAPMFERIQAVADSVLLEGYALYPYTASSTKNRYRWTFGVLAPRAYCEGQVNERFSARAECLIQQSGDQPVEIRGRLRFLRVWTRDVHELVAERFHETARLDVEGRSHVAWQEGELEEVDFEASFEHPELERRFPFELRAEREEQLLTDASGAVHGKLVRTSAELRGEIQLRLEPAPAGGGRLHKLCATIVNLSAPPEGSSARADVMPAALASAHLLLAAPRAEFVSLLDPPAHAAVAARSCNGDGLYPVLAGGPGADALLCSPIILYDNPRIAPESGGDFYDATEIDELLTLRTLTLTPEEKAQARSLDPRVLALMERVEAASPEELARLHGALRSPEDGAAFRPGARVRLRPGARRTDAQDALFAGCTARVEEVRQDVEGRTLLGVTIEQDPAAELHRWYGRYHYYAVDEVELLDEEAR